MSNSNKTPGVGFLDLLTLIFIVLRLLNKINWSWVWVLSPIWIPLVLVLLKIAVKVIVEVLEDLNKKKGKEND